MMNTETGFDPYNHNPYGRFPLVGRQWTRSQMESFRGSKAWEPTIIKTRNGSEFWEPVFSTFPFGPYTS